MFLWLMVPLFAVGRFQLMALLYWTLQDLKDSKSKQ
jgi:hypothetical protein